MEFLAMVFGLLYGGDVTALGHRDFQTRHAAHMRLMAVGRPAVPVLLAGFRSDCPERQMRCHRLLVNAGWIIERGDWDNLFVRPWKWATAMAFMATEKTYHKH